MTTTQRVLATEKFDSMSLETFKKNVTQLLERSRTHEVRAHRGMTLGMHLDALESYHTEINAYARDFESINEGSPFARIQARTALLSSYTHAITTYYTMESR